MQLTAFENSTFNFSEVLILKRSNKMDNRVLLWKVEWKEEGRASNIPITLTVMFVEYPESMPLFLQANNANNS